MRSAPGILAIYRIERLLTLYVHMLALLNAMRRSKIYKNTKTIAFFTGYIPRLDITMNPTKLMQRTQ